MTIHPWSPEIQLAKLDHEFEDILDHFMRHDWAEAKPYPRKHCPAIESFVDSGHLVIRADLPGVDPKDVEIKVAGDLLTISGTRAAAAIEEERLHFMQREISYGIFERAISIPKGVKEEDICAVWRNGVLELKVLLAEGIEIKQVPLQIFGRAKGLETN
jgi:HSP20 family protein